MTDNSPKAIVLRANELFDGTDAGTDRFLEMFAESAVWEFAPTTESPQWRRVEGREAARALYYFVYRQRRDVSVTVHEVVAEGDTVALVGTMWNTLTVDARGFPAGSRLRFEYASIFKVRDGLIVSAKQLSGPGLLDETK